MQDLTLFLEAEQGVILSPFEERGPADVRLLPDVESHP
jgi:hypothetical protein